MRVYTRIEIDIESGQVISSESYDYSGPIEECKGSNVAEDQMKQQNALQQQAFTLMQKRQNEVGGAVSKYLSGNVGYDPQQLALLKSQFLNSNAAQYQQAGRNVRTALLRSGSDSSTAPVGGDYVRGISGLEGAMASNASSGLANIDLQNLEQMLNNKFNAASLINGQAAQLTSPISSFGSGASNALSNYVYAANQGFGSSLARGFGSVLGAGLGAGLTGGIGNMLSGFGKFGSGFSSGVNGGGGQ